MIKLSILFFITIMFVACQKKELPAPAFNRGNVITTQVEMGSNYKNQIWYSLANNSIISTNNRTDWDLAFESSSVGNQILLNGSKSMKVYKTGFTNIALVNDTIGLEANSKADVPSGNKDSTAFGTINDQETVFIINRGYSETGIQQGFYKLKIKSVSTTQFVFEYGDVFGTQLYTGSVNKNPDYNYIMYSFTTNQSLSIEPRKIDYDLCFTAYTHYFTNPFQYYQVTGVLQNNYKTRVALINNKPFSDIEISDTTSRQFSANRNAIGYGWKVFKIATNVFTVDPSLCYIINDSKGFYYKLHFIDFYSSSGLKGFPKFEFKKL